ncbi:MAG: PilN domain-containing protein [Armatimonadota bacterium]
MININLIAERRARKVREVTVLRRAMGGSLLVLLVMVVLSVTFLISYTTEAFDMRSTEKIYQTKLEQQEELNTLRAEIAAQIPVADLLDQVRMSEGAWMTILADMSRYTPDDVAITTLNANTGPNGIELKVNGMAKDEDTVGKFMVSIRENTRWAKAPTVGTITADVREDVKRVRFDITIPVVGMMGGEL